MRAEEEAMELYDKYEYLIEQTIRMRFSNQEFLIAHGLTRDDIYQYARIGLHKACETYDESKKAAFRTHAINCIAWTVGVESKRDTLGCDQKYLYNLVDRTSMDQILPLDDGFEINLHDVLGQEEIGYETIEAEEIINRIAKVTSEKNVTIVKMRADGYTYQEIADVFNTSHQSIRVSLNRARKKMMKALQPA